jgi:hypothetical protein
MWLLSLVTASAEPLRGAVILTPLLSNADMSAILSARMGDPDSSQIGAEVRWAEVSKAWIDGWPVEEGSAASVLVRGAVPLARAERLRLDLRVQAGGRQMWARQTTSPDDRSLALLTEVGPRATLLVAEPAAVWVGFENVLDFQLDPSFATDALGQRLGAGLVVAPDQNLQLELFGEAGGLYGYDGDGAKFSSRAGLSLKIVPGAARSWLWL